MFPSDHQAQLLARKNFLLVPSQAYASPSALASDVERLRASWDRLAPDTNSVGRRLRRFQGSIWMRRYAGVYPVANKGYVQEKSYNALDGGRLRFFADMEPETVVNPAFRAIVRWHVALVAKSGIFPANQPVVVNFHQVRHQPTEAEAAFSSPAGDHRDPEEIVSLVGVGRSKNLIGGFNLLATDPDRPNDMNLVFRLNAPLDSYVITKKMLHAVTLMLAQPGTGEAYRDSLIISFRSTDNPPQPISDDDLTKAANLAAEQVAPADAASPRR